MDAIENYEVYAIRYATLARKAAENFIGGDPHEEGSPLDYYVWLARSPTRSFVIDTGFDALVAERGRVIAALRAQGWDIPASEANFVWLELGERTMEFAAAAERAGLVVRPFAGSGARCTVAEPESADLLIDVAREFRSA